MLTEVWNEDRYIPPFHCVSHVFPGLRYFYGGTQTIFPASSDHKTTNPKGFRIRALRCPKYFTSPQEQKEHRLLCHLPLDLPPPLPSPSIWLSAPESPSAPPFRRTPPWQPPPESQQVLPVMSPYLGHGGKRVKRALRPNLCQPWLRSRLQYVVEVPVRVAAPTSSHIAIIFMEPPDEQAWPSPWSKSRATLWRYYTCAATLTWQSCTSSSPLLISTTTIMVNPLISDAPVDLGERNVGQPLPPALHAVLRPQRRADGGGVRRRRGEHRRLENVSENLQHLPKSVRRGKGVTAAIQGVKSFAWAHTPS